MSVLRMIKDFILKDNSLKNSLFIINYVIRIFDYSMLICNYNGECSFNFKEREK